MLNVVAKSGADSVYKPTTSSRETGIGSSHNM